MEKNLNNMADLIIRYALAPLLSINSLFIFYFIFTPLTLYPVAFLLSLFYDVRINGLFILVNCHAIELVEACIAGSAYYLLAILNITTRNIKVVKRIKMFLFGAFLLLILNIIRIVFLTILEAESLAFFDIAHLVFWYVISTLFVVFIWILTIKKFKIETVPVLSDILYLKSFIKPKSKKKTKKKKTGKKKVKKRKKR